MVSKAEDERDKIKLNAAEKNIVFLQNEHSRTLNDLHNEIETLKNKCKKLQFSLEVGNFPSFEEDQYQTRINALEAEASHWCQECSRLKDHLCYAEDVVSNLENVLAKQFKQSEREISSRDEKIVLLEKESSQKSRTILSLTAELRRFRERDIVSKKLLVRKPNRPSSSSSSRSAESSWVLNTRKLPLRSKSQTYESFIESHSKRLESSLEKDRRSRAITLTSYEAMPNSRGSPVTRLPPIVRIPKEESPNPSVRQSGSKVTRSFVRQQLRLNRETELNLETLAIDHPSLSGETSAARLRADQS